MKKGELLSFLEKKMADNDLLPLRESNLVFGEGSPGAEVMFIGEAPGIEEDKQKRPFVGRSGQLLRASIRKLNWEEGDVYITNIVKRRPPGNRDPSPEEIEAYKPYLNRQIEIIDPKIIVSLGRFAMNYFLPEAKITRDQGKIFDIGGRLLVPMFHPAAALRGNNTMVQFAKTIKKLPNVKRYALKRVNDR